MHLRRAKVVRHTSRPLQFLRLYVTGHYAWLLSVLLLMTFVAPMVGEFDLIDHVYIADVLLLALLAVAAYTFLDSALHAGVVVVLALGTLACGAISRVPEQPIIGLEIAGIVCMSALLFFMAVLIAGDIFTSSKVDEDTICGSLSVYLLFVLFFAGVYTSIQMLDPESFRGIPAEFAADQSLGPNLIMIYFSTVTITTLGYGDITPLHIIPRSLASFEALLGQVYLTVLVARLVGLTIAGVGRTQDS